MTSHREKIFAQKDKIFIDIRYLMQDEQEAYQKIIQHYSKWAKRSLDVPIEGSNLFKVLKLNEMFKGDGKRIASLIDLEGLIESNSPYLNGFYIDTPVVVLRSAGDSYERNDSIAKDLAKQIRKRTFKNPVIITELKVRTSRDFSYGLKFKVTNKSEIIEAPELSYSNNGKRFNRLNERGLPIFEEDGRLKISTREDGISGLYINEEGFNAWYGNLAHSNKTSRVMVIDPKNT